MDTPARSQPTSKFNAVWFVASLGIAALLTVSVVFGLPRIVPMLDFEGSAGMLVAVPTWFLGGLLVGPIAPAGRLIEVAMATAIVAAPTAFLLFKGQTVKTMPAVLYAVVAVVGLLFAVIGAHLGERLQQGPSSKSSPRAPLPRGPSPRS